MTTFSPEGEALYYVDLINRLLATKQYDWARGTLEGIAADAERWKRITSPQKQAVDHIITGKLKHDAARERSA